MGFLEGELEHWLENALINEEQAAGIRAIYGVQRRPFSLIMLCVGGALVGLGAVSFAAEQWNAKHLEKSANWR